MPNPSDEVPDNALLWATTVAGFDFIAHQRSLAGQCRWCGASIADQFATAMQQYCAAEVVGPATAPSLAARNVSMCAYRYQMARRALARKVTRSR